MATSKKTSRIPTSTRSQLKTHLPSSAAIRRGDHVNDRVLRRLKLEKKAAASAPVIEKHFHILDAAQILGLSPWTLRHKMGRGELVYRRIGRRIFISQSELNRIAGPLHGSAA